MPSFVPLLLHILGYDIVVKETIVTALLKMTSHHAGFVLLQGPNRRVHDSSESDSVSRIITEK